MLCVNDKSDYENLHQFALQSDMVDLRVKYCFLRFDKCCDSMEIKEMFFKWSFRSKSVELPHRR